MKKVSDGSTAASGVEQLLAVMQRLRDPEGGCPWDLEQTLTSLIPYTIEEAYEVAAALQEGRPEEIKDELGDLLFQVVFYTHLTDEQGWFNFDDVAAGMADKLIRRHPHVFGDSAAKLAAEFSQAEIKAQWEEIKQQERRQKDEVASVFANVPHNLPALLMAGKLQKRAASVGFDWSEWQTVIAKVREETAEVEAELVSDQRDQDAVEEEIGDLLFAVVNLARHAQVNPEHALGKANQKFKRRFQQIEQRLQENQLEPQEQSLAELEAHWQAVKATEK